MAKDPNKKTKKQLRAELKELQNKGKSAFAVQHGLKLDSDGRIPYILYTSDAEQNTLNSDVFACFLIKGNDWKYERDNLVEQIAEALRIIKNSEPYKKVPIIIIFDSPSEILELAVRAANRSRGLGLKIFKIALPGGDLEELS